MLKKALFALRSIGIYPTLRTVRYARQRDRIEKRFPVQAPGKAARSPENPGTFTAIPNGISLNFENGIVLESVVIAPRIIRITWTPGHLPHPYAVQKLPEPGNILLDLKPDEARIASDAFETRVYGSGKISFHERVQTKDSEDRSVETHVYLSGNGTIHSVESGPAVKVFDPPVYMEPGWRQISHLYPHEAVYGLGEKAGKLNLRGRSFRMWNMDPGGSYGQGADPLYMGIPVYMGLNSGGGYLVFYENSYESQVSFSPSGQQHSQSEIVFHGGALRAYLIVGTPAECLDAYGELTGKAAMPPRWALGYHQSRWGYKSEADIREVASGYEQHDLPISSIHLDIDYMDGYRVFTVNKNRYPNLGQLSEDMEKQNIKLVTILDPGVKRDILFDVYRTGSKNELFCTTPDKKRLHALVWPGWCAFPDFTNPATRAWWGDFYPRLLDQGIAGIWHDMNEPAAFTSWGEPTLPINTRHHMEGRGGDHQEAHNLYGLLMGRAGHEALKRHRPERRPWLLTRSGWAGIQRYSWHWTGDTETSWDSLRMTIPEVLGIGLSGVPYSGPDIGGFSGAPDAKLFTRWFQLAAFMPFFRNHAAVGTPRREPWCFGEETVAICRKFLETRYQLLPYLYTLAWEAAQTGAPLVRPLFWNNPEETGLHSIDDAFFLGDALLVAPLLEDGSSGRTVTLPPGIWYDFWCHDRIAHNTETNRLTCPGGLDHAPVLVRGGSILPIDQKGVLHVHVYPDENNTATGLLYDDSGDGYEDYSLHRFELSSEPDQLRLQWTTEGSYPFSFTAIVVHLHSFQIQQVLVDGKPVPNTAKVALAKPFKDILIS